MMILGPRKIHRPFGNVPGNKISDRKIKQMQREYIDGDSRGTIAVRHGVSWSTAQRHTHGLRSPVKNNLSTIEVSRLLAGWQACG